MNLAGICANNLGMKRLGFKKSEKLCKKNDFDRVFNEGRVCRDGVLTLRLIPNQLEYSRLGAVVGSKRVKSAVKRNRLKRLIREAFRLSKSQLPKGMDIVLSLRKPDDVSLDAIVGSLLKLTR